MINKIEGKCQFKGCEKPATHIAAGSYQKSKAKVFPYHPEPNCYCSIHAEIVANEGVPKNGTQFTSECPNCGCFHGVN